MRSWNARLVTQPCFWLPCGCNCACTCVCVFFFFPSTKQCARLFSAAPPMRAPSSAVRLFKSVAARVQRHMCGIFQAATARLSCQIGSCALAFPLNASTLWGPHVETLGRWKGQRAKKPPLPTATTGRARRCGAICTSILTGFTGK